MTKLLAVIHVPFHDPTAFALQQAYTALKNGADGVFIIDMNGYTQGQDLVSVATMTKLIFPNAFIGINDLCTPVEEMIHLVAHTGIDAIWTDRVGNSELIEQARLASICNIPIFRGVIFKYQPDYYTPITEIPKYLAKINLGVNDVLTTSGAGTGSAADIKRIRAIAEANNRAHPMALASGVSAENVRTYLPYVDYILAASSIIDENDCFVPEKIKELASIIKEKVDG